MVWTPATVCSAPCFCHAPFLRLRGWEHRPCSRTWGTCPARWSTVAQPPSPLVGDFSSRANRRDCCAECFLGPCASAYRLDPARRGSRYVRSSMARGRCVCVLVSMSRIAVALETGDQLACGLHCRMMSPSASLPDRVTDLSIGTPCGSESGTWMFVITNIPSKTVSVNYRAQKCLTLRTTGVIMSHGHERLHGQPAPRCAYCAVAFAHGGRNSRWDLQGVPLPTRTWCLDDAEP